jgi:hypothetical protein
MTLRWLSRQPPDLSDGEPSRRFLVRSFSPRDRQRARWENVQTSGNLKIRPSRSRTIWIARRLEAQQSSPRDGRPPRRCAAEAPSLQDRQVSRWEDVPPSGSLELLPSWPRTLLVARRPAPRQSSPQDGQAPARPALVLAWAWTIQPSCRPGPEPSRSRAAQVPGRFDRYP